MLVPFIDRHGWHVRALPGGHLQHGCSPLWLLCRLSTSTCGGWTCVLTLRALGYQRCQQGFRGSDLGACLGSFCRQRPLYLRCSASGVCFPRGSCTRSYWPMQSSACCDWNPRGSRSLLRAESCPNAFAPRLPRFTGVFIESWQAPVCLDGAVCTHRRWHTCCFHACKADQRHRARLWACTGRTCRRWLMAKPWSGMVPLSDRQCLMAACWCMDNMVHHDQLLCAHIDRSAKPSIERLGGEGGHAWNCRAGGWAMARHAEGRSLMRELATTFWLQQCSVRASCA